MDTPAATEISPGLDARLHAYAEWVRELIQGKSVDHLIADGPGSLAELGHELERLAQAIASREEQLRRLLVLVQSVESGIFLDEVLNRIFDGFKGLIPYDRIGCAFVSENGLRAVAYWGRSTMGPMKISKGFSQALAGSSLNKVLQTGSPRIINDLEAYLAENPKSASTRLVIMEGGRSSLTCPLYYGTRPMGFLFFTSRERNVYDAAHQAMFQQIATQVSIVIEKSRLYEQAIRQNELLKARSEELEGIASRDSLTGILNRRAIEEVLRQRHDHAIRSGRSFGVIIADIDHFKKINDTLGHDGGDRALIEFAARMARAVRKTDQFGRMGGEEFLIVVDCNGPQELHDAAERLRRCIEEHDFPITEDGHRVTASFGAAHLGDDPLAIEVLLKRADTALYQAKSEGRNCCRVA